MAYGHGYFIYYINMDNRYIVAFMLSICGTWILFYLSQLPPKKEQSNVIINTKVINMSNKGDTIIIVRDGIEQYKLIKLH